MGSILKREKLSEGQYEDRISNLPNSLITQILSRLPTKYAVATSVLSTRWKQLWTSISSLDFDDTLLSCPQNRRTDASLQRSFTSFVRRVLLHHVSCVQRFRLTCSQSYDASLVNGWISDALLRNVRELDLYIWREHCTMLPQDLFTCRTLVVLKLKAYGDMISVPSLVSLPSLRILHLDCIIFVDDDSINRFLFGCPVLEELSMIKCMEGNVSVVYIVAPTLTSLVMQYAYRWLPHGFERKIVLDTPALLNLKIRDFVKGICYLVENLHHLIRAEIFLYADEDSAISKALTDLLKGMSNVQFLKLGFIIEDTLRDCQLPKFPNMTCLELGQIYYVQWEFLMEFLENSPRLETLVFKEGLGYFDDCEEFKRLQWSPDRDIPSCLLFHLKEIEISDFRGKKIEWKIVNYFLQNAKVLEKVNIDCGYGVPKWTIHASRT